MCIRQIDGKAVLSYFNASTGNMEVRVADDPTSLGDAPVTTVVQHDDWPEPAESLPPPYDNRLAQPYGGYISPGSTLDELRIFVSQWDTRARVTRAVPGDPVRGQPVQTLTGGPISRLCPQYGCGSWRALAPLHCYYVTSGGDQARGVEVPEIVHWPLGLGLAGEAVVVPVRLG